MLLSLLELKLEEEEDADDDDEDDGLDKAAALAEELSLVEWELLEAASDDT